MQRDTTGPRTVRTANLASLSVLRLLLAGLLLSLSGASWADEQPQRQVTLTEGSNKSIHQYNTRHNKSSLTTKRVLPNPQYRSTASVQNDFWIFDLTIGFGRDTDHDGHYSTFNISFDVDTHYRHSDVYAVLYLSLDGGYWTEYAVTADFTVSGTGPGDRYTLSANLDSGYPHGYYDHYVEIYDAHSHELVSSYGPQDTHYQLDLPFEGSYHDTGGYNSAYGGGYVNSNVSLSFSGTGPIAFPTLLVLSILASLRRLLCRGNRHAYPQAVK